MQRFRVEGHWRPARGLPPPSVGLGAVLARARPRLATTLRKARRGLRASLRAAASRAAGEARARRYRTIERGIDKQGVRELQRQAIERFLGK